MLTERVYGAMLTPSTPPPKKVLWRYQCSGNVQEQAVPEDDEPAIKEAKTPGVLGLEGGNM